MKKLFILISILSIVFSLFYSCKQEDDKYEYEFIERILQGSIDSTSFLYNTAIAEKDYWDSNKMSVKIYESNNSDPCNALTIPGKKVSFSIPLAKGLYELKFSTSTNQNQIVTIYNPETSKTYNATEGAIEITSLDTILNLVVGKMDVYVDENTKINGDFQAVYCRE